MTLYDTIQSIVAAAREQPTVYTIARGDMYKINESPKVRYGVFAYVQGTHTSGDGYNAFSFTFVYADRLDELRGNVEWVQSTGIQTIDNIIYKLEDEGIMINEYSYDVFTERFSDECAGVMARVTLRVPKVFPCYELVEIEKNVIEL